jgi:hypothetical protein
MPYLQLALFLAACSAPPLEEPPAAKPVGPSAGEAKDYESTVMEAVFHSAVTPLVHELQLAHSSRIVIELDMRPDGIGSCRATVAPSGSALSGEETERICAAIAALDLARPAEPTVVRFDLGIPRRSSSR